MDLNGQSGHHSSGNLTRSNSGNKLWRHDTHSHGCVFSTMEGFVQSVEEMNETILLPSRLMGDKFEKSPDKNVDLYAFYSIINSVKNDLLWGADKSTFGVKELKTALARKGSLGSVDVEDMSLSGSEDGSETEEDYGQNLAKNFRKHLFGLQKCLNELTFGANELAAKYQIDLGNI